MKKKFFQRKLFWIISVILLAAVIVLADQIRKPKETDAGGEIVYDPAGMEAMPQYFGGVTEAENTVTIQKDPERTVKEVYVNAGDHVAVGQQLFAYETADLQASLDQANLELSSYGTDIQEIQNQIADLTNQMNAASDENARADLSSQIASLNIQIRQSQLSQSAKQTEIENLQKQIDGSVVASSIDGVIRDFNANADGGTGQAYMTILSGRAFQIRGIIDELNISSIQEGMPVIIHSRVSEDTWKGKIMGIDREPLKQAEQGGMDGASVSGASRYAFHVTLDSAEGLMLGQHVYIEPISEKAGGDAQ